MSRPDEHKEDEERSSKGSGTGTQPEIEPLASRLERSRRVDWCAQRTFEMLAHLARSQPGWTVLRDVWVKGTCTQSLAVGPPGVFLVWSFDMRWTTNQAEMVMPARREIQAELGAEWPGKVEAVFHSPRHETSWHRHVFAAEEVDDGEFVDLVWIGGRIDEVLGSWEPAGEVYLDSAWLEWFTQASQERWWKSNEGFVPLPPPPADES